MEENLLSENNNLFERWHPTICSHYSFHNILLVNYVRLQDRPDDNFHTQLSGGESPRVATTATIE